MGDGIRIYSKYDKFRGADCNTDHPLVVVKFRETLVVSKQAAQKFDVEILGS